MIRYIARIIIYPLANPILKSFFTLSHLDDYIAIITYKIKSYHKAISLVFEYKYDMTSGIIKVKTELARYQKIIEELKQLINKLNLKSLQNEFIFKLDGLSCIITLLIEHMASLGDYNNNNDNETTHQDNKEQRLRETIETGKSLLDQYLDYSNNLHSLYRKISYIELAKLFFSTFKILDFFNKVLKLNYPIHVEHDIKEDNIM